MSKVELTSNNQLGNVQINNQGPSRQQMFQTADLNPMFHQRNDVQVEESWGAAPEGSSKFCSFHSQVAILRDSELNHSAS